MRSQVTDCPFCGEEIKSIAKKCKHCGEMLDPTVGTQQRSSAMPVINISNVNTASVSGRIGKRWSPIVAFLLSLFIPGLGQLYKGQFFNGLLWFVIVVIGYVAYIIPGLILHICCALGAAMGNPYK